MEKETKKKAAPKAKEAVTNKEIISERKSQLLKRNKIYKLTGKHARTPFVRIQGADKPSSRRLLWFDEEKGYERALRYVRNHPSPFIDDQEESKGSLTPGHVVFEKGVLGVDANNVALQAFLDHHPWNEKNGGNGPIKFYEHDPVAIAEAEVQIIISEAEALKAALDADLVTTEAVLRPILGSKVHSSKSEELTRELLIYAKTHPAEFMDDIQNEQLLINNMAYTAFDFGILKLKDNGRTVVWGDSNKKILSIPFGEDTYQYVGDWFTTDTGVEYLNKVTQRLKK